MFLNSLFERGSLGVMQKTMAFTEARHKVLVNNVTNFDTVGYKVQDLPAEQFHQAMREAVQRRNRRGAGAPLELQPQRNFRYDSRGHLQASAVEIEDNNILFHDENNRFLEKQMVQLRKNTGKHRMMAELLGQQYSLLRSAIRGQV